MHEHERLVRYVAGKFRPAGCISTEDLVQVGFLGLMAALDRYDPRSGVAFKTFAVPTIVGMIKHHLRDHSWGVKVPRRVRELAVRLRRLRDLAEVRLGHAPTTADMAAVAGVQDEEILEAMVADAAYFPCSLDAPTVCGGEITDSFQELLGTEEPAFARFMERDALRAALQTVEPRERAVIEGRFFRDLSQVQVATELGMSQMHVSRLERRALGHLRELLGRSPCSG